jgi:hypothetical protein
VGEAAAWIAFHDIASLDVEIEMLGQVLDFELPDITGLVDRDAFLFECFVQWNETGAVESIGSEEQEDAEIFMGVGTGDGGVLGIHAFISMRGLDIRSPMEEKICPTSRGSSKTSSSHSHSSLPSGQM